MAEAKITQAGVAVISEEKKDDVTQAGVAIFYEEKLLRITQVGIAIFYEAGAVLEEDIYGAVI